MDAPLDVRCAVVGFQTLVLWGCPTSSQGLNTIRNTDTVTWRHRHPPTDGKRLSLSVVLPIADSVVASAVQGLPRCDPEWERAGKYVTGNIIHLFSALPFAKASENRLRLMVCI